MFTSTSICFPLVWSSKGRAIRILPRYQKHINNCLREVVQACKVTTHAKWLSPPGTESTLNVKFPFYRYSIEGSGTESALCLLQTLFEHHLALVPAQITEDIQSLTNRISHSSHEVVSALPLPIPFFCTPMVWSCPSAMPGILLSSLGMGWLVKQKGSFTLAETLQFCFSRLRFLRALFCFCFVLLSSHNLLLTHI